MLILGDPWPIAFPRNLAPDLTHYLSERPDEFSRREFMEGQTNEKEESNVTKKAKKTSKLRDLKPTKDAKGGRGRCSDYLNRRVQ